MLHSKFGSAILRRELQGMELHTALVFYIGIPVFAGTLLGWNQAFVGQEVPRVVSVPFWVGLALLEWFAAAMGSQVAFGLLRPWRPPPWVVWTVGVALSAVVFYYPISRYLEFGSSLGGAPNLPAHMSGGSPLQFVVMAITDILPGMALWMAANFFYDRFLGIPRHRYSVSDGLTGSPDSHPAAESATRVVDRNIENPAFMERVSTGKRGRLLALEAQDHYVCVTTDRGKELIHYRFSDAVRDAQIVPGVRAHRSYWVALDAIVGLEREKQSEFLQLENGVRIPVSRSYLREVREAVTEAAPPDSFGPKIGESG